MPSWRLLLTCFAVIALLFAATKVVSWVRGRQLHAAIQKTMRDALSSAELVARMGRDLDGERQFLDNHILESNRAGMERVEERLTAFERDLTAAASGYDALADEPEEARISGTLDAELAEAHPVVDEVLALSRDNRDADARRELAVANRRFARIGAESASSSRSTASASRARWLRSTAPRTGSTCCSAGSRSPASRSPPSSEAPPSGWCTAASGSSSATRRGSRSRTTSSTRSPAASRTICAGR